MTKNAARKIVIENCPVYLKDANDTAESMQSQVY